MYCKKVVFISHSSGRSGAEIAMVELIRALRPYGIQCVTIVPRAGPLSVLLAESNIEERVVPYGWWMERKAGVLKRVIRTVWNAYCAVIMAYHLRQVGADAVITNTITTPVGAMAAALVGLPHVWSIHEFGREDHGLRFDIGDRTSYWLMKSLTHAFIVNSNTVKEKYQMYLPSDQLNVCYQSVSPNREGKVDLPARKENEFRCACVGWLQKEKGHHEAVQAIGDLKRKGFNVRLWIIGSGDPDYEDTLKILAKELGVEGNVTMCGFVPSPFLYLKQMDALLMCSQMEAFGRVTVEGMLAGLPVIGANSGCTPELVSVHKTGLLYKSGDPADLAEKLRYLITHRDEAREMGKRGKGMAEEKYSATRYGEAVLGVIKSVTNARRACR